MMLSVASDEDPNRCWAATLGPQKFVPNPRPAPNLCMVTCISPIKPPVKSKAHELVLLFNSNMKDPSPMFWF